MEMTHIRADQPSQLPEGKPGAVPAAKGHANTGWGAPHVCLWLGALPGALQLVCCVIVQNVLEGSVPD